ncbi:MAG TPA: hypothetical protein VMY87_03495 [Armatimonadota bacterium]|nr:hypothetical protein [Armatimonadota bacterium]
MQAQDLPFEGLTRTNIQDYLIACLRTGGGTRPALLLLQDGDRRAIVKDYLPASWLLRAVFGPWLIGREERLYHVLDGAPGVPQLIGRLDRHALLVEHIDGRACSEYPDGALPPEFFQRLEAVVNGIHARGVVHCDIKNRANIVVADEFEPYIVDFASAFTREGRFGPLRRFAFERFRLDDRRAVVKARLLVGGIGNEADERFAFHHGPAERAIRALRNAARWLFKALAGH